MSGGGADTSIRIDRLVVRYGAVTAVRSLTLSVKEGELLTLLGPSGCGKTTALRAIAGLEQPVAGEIEIGGRIVYSSSRGLNMPVEQRGVSMVFQSYALWPNMSVYDNVAYGLRVRRKTAREIDDKVRWALDLVRMGDHATRSATKLSGGQQQRVALARAVAFSPQVLLLDEPLSNLDARLRAEMRVEIRELQRRLGITAVYVTHDQEEALAISDRVVVMRAGLIEQAGDPLEIYDRPRNAFVSDFVGSANLIRGRVRTELCANDTVALQTVGGALVFGVGAARGLQADGTLAIRTTYPILSRQRPAVERNTWRMRVVRRVFLGDFVEYRLDWDGTPFLVRRLPTDRFEEGEEIYLTVDPQHCVLTEDDRQDTADHH